MITADQIVCHLVGDYILQSEWMASEKTKQSLAAICHVLAYSVAFLFLRPSIAAMAFIIVTHFIIDRWRLARYVVWAKNFIAPWQMSEPWVFRSDNPNWSECKATGYPSNRPDWLAVWLLIVADNTLHLICNGVALKYF